MKKLLLCMPLVFFTSCAMLDRTFNITDPDTGAASTTTVGDQLASNATDIAQQTGMLTSLISGNPALGGAVATLLTGAGALFAAKKVKKKKAAAAESTGDEAS